MSNTLGDCLRELAKIYRDHDQEVPRELRANRRGFAVLSQDLHGAYQTTCPGDEVGWVYLPPRKRQKRPKYRAEITGGT